MTTPRTIAALLLGGLVLLGVQACSDDPATPAVTPQPQACTASAECSGEAAGHLCIASACRPCNSDSGCADDPAYGAGATCDLASGACTSCLGQEGCACDDGGCQGELTCQRGLCQVPEEEPCVDGDEDCDCFSNDTCLAGLRCEGGTCELCPPGAQGCACGEDDACDDGLLCQNEVCAPDPCPVGTDDCPCEEDDTCDEGLVCTGDGMCAPCTPEFEGCPCHDDQTCDNDLVCGDDDTCRQAIACANVTCADHQLCEAPTGADAGCIESCEDGFDWNGTSGMCDVHVATPNCDPNAEASRLDECTALHRTCEATANDASCGACLTGYVADGDLCRAPIACAMIDCAAQHRDCVGGDVVDATCAGCSTGFVDDGNGTCAAIPVANCDVADPDSMLEACTAQNRTCVADANGASCGTCLTGFAEVAATMTCEPATYCDDLDCDARNLSCEGEPFATCGGCLPGTLVDENDPDRCRLTLTCDDITCADGEFCTEVDGADAICASWPCSDANGDPLSGPTPEDPTRPWYALRSDNGMCVQCNIVCGETGESGRVYPFTLRGSNECICETEPGFFFGTGDIQGANPCDEDGDGWVRDAAKPFITSNDRTLRTNARCEVRQIDRFTLQNEWGQRYEILLCEDHDVPAALGTCDAPPSGASSPPVIVSLYETVRNDSQDDLEAALDVTSSGYYRDATGRGRRPRTEELNPLSRLCLNETGDYNHNGVDDVRESHNMDASNLGTEQAVFARYTYYAELHRGFYEAPEPEVDGQGRPLPGAYVIEERSRCEAGFPLTYAAAVDGGDWWSQCQRGRDTAFNDANPLINMEFGEFSCSDSMGGCNIPQPVTAPAASDEIAPHGLCEVTLPANSPWRGMAHHSQFKCAVIDATTGAAPSLGVSSLTDAAGDGTWQFNRCGVACPEDDPTCAVDCDATGCLTSSTAAVEGPNPSTAEFVCTAVPRGQVTTDMVGFVAARYDRSPTYVRGCIDEWSYYRTLCPGFDPATCFADSNGDQVPDDFDADGFADQLTPNCTVAGQGHPGNFGALICGCGFNFGGPECDFGCSDASARWANTDIFTSNVHYGGVASGAEGVCLNGYCAVTPDDGSGAGGRLGYWLCGDFTVTQYLEGAGANGEWSTGGEWAIRGDIDATGLTGERLCQNAADCDCQGDACTPTGWTIQGTTRR